MYRKYCAINGNKPIMLPRAPEQTYIDVSSNCEDDKRHQSDYETEVVVYRALERLDGGFIVLHSFKYTHHHYRVCDSSHVPKGCKQCKSKLAPIEGECDFIIVLPNCIVIIEVKNMTNVVECEPSTSCHLCTNKCCKMNALNERLKLNALNALKGTFKKSEKQREKIVKLIQSIDPDMKTLQFTAYPNFSRRYSGQFQVENVQLATIIFQEDFSGEEAFADWWRAKVSGQIVEPTTSTESKITNILLAIWADDYGDITKCDRKFSFGKCIINIDKRLREGLITFVAKNGKHRSHLVKKTTKIIKDNLGVHNLTVQQKDVLDSSEKLMWLNGPAGAGKTVIMCGKIIKLMLESDQDSRVMLFRSIGGNGTDLQKTESLYQSALKKADIRFKVINQQQIDSTVSDGDIKVIIVDIKDHQRAAKLIDQFSGEFHLFFDDAQKVLYYSTRGGEYGVFIDKLKKMSENKVIWIACDMVQGWRYLGQRYTRELAKTLKETLSDEQRKCLSMNLRNTCDLSNILYVIRDRFILRYQQGGNRLPVDMILPKQTPGHFIHGTNTVINVLNNYDLDTIDKLLKTELGKLADLCEHDVSNNSEVPASSSQANEVQKVNSVTNLGIVYNSSSSDVESLVKEIVNEQKDKQKIALCDSVFSYSVEWPAVIVLHQMWGDLDNDLPALYLAMSRARVHCFLILYPDGGETTRDHNEEMLELVKELKDYAHVRYIFDEDD